jgi:hypothetical protein
MTEARREVYEDKVRADADRVQGRLLKTWFLTGYVGDTDDQWDSYFEKPVLVRLQRPLDDDLVVRYGDAEWIDPIWYVEPLPGQGLNLRSCRMDGTSYNWKTGESQCGRWELVPENPILLRLRWFFEDVRMAWRFWRKTRRQMARRKRARGAAR